MTIAEKLTEYSRSGVLPMHMPGHKRRSGFLWLDSLSVSMDITELDGFDNLNDPHGMFLDLSQRLSKLYGAKKSVPLVNGSTAGILAAVRSCAGENSTALISRNCHKSVYHGCELAGCDVSYIVPVRDSNGIWLSVTPESVENALRNNDNIHLVVVTSPTYEGIISDIASISEICHRYNAVLLVDEAHGAHLGFDGFPETSVRLGADIVVQSLHKTLPSLTQTAVLHICPSLPEELSREVIRNAAIFQTSSPSYLLSSSIDGCVRFMETDGNRECRLWRENLRVIDSLTGYGVLFRSSTDRVFAYDPSKVVVSGVEADFFRHESGIEPEMESDSFVLFMTGLADTQESIERLANAIKSSRYSAHTTPTSSRERREPEAPPLPRQVMKPSAAVKMRAVTAEPEKALGKVSGEYITMYPPCSPILVPGELVDERVIEKTGGKPLRVLADM